MSIYFAGNNPYLFVIPLIVVVVFYNNENNWLYLKRFLSMTFPESSGSGIARKSANQTDINVYMQDE
jgi:hypothetical protein